MTDIMIVIVQLDYPNKPSILFLYVTSCMAFMFEYVCPAGDPTRPLPGESSSFVTLFPV